MKKFSKTESLLFIVSLCLIICAFFFNQNNAILILIILLALGLVYALTPRFTGLSGQNPKVRTIRRMTVWNMVLTVSLWAMTAFADMDFREDISYEFWILIGLMVLTGNSAPKLPFNRYIGLRLPWTIRDESTWRIAHKILGYLTFPLTLIMVIGYNFAADKDPVVAAGVIAWIAIPGLYSLFHYYKIRTGS